jgi:CelD/BcsL family acetyltransferase involved in cellulose biosynthesis
MVPHGRRLSGERALSYIWRKVERPAVEPDGGEQDRVDIVTDRTGFDRLEQDWNGLFERAGRGPHVFQTFNWNWHWANHYLTTAAGKTPTKLAIVTVYRRGRLVLLWPLVAERFAGLKILRWMGEPVSQYGDALIDDVHDKAALLRRALQRLHDKLAPDVIFMRKVRADATIAAHLTELGMSVTDRGRAPNVDLASAPDFAAYEQRYSGKARKNRRRLMRRLNEEGAVSFERHRSGASAEKAARDAIELKRAWLKATGRISPALADQRYTDFFAEVAHGRGRPAGCELSVLRLDGQTAGVAIDVTSKGHRAAHIIVHDRRFDRLSAGTLLFEHWVRTAAGDRIPTFDLLAPAYAYKSEWADGMIDVGDFACGLTLRGRTFVRLYLRLRPKMKAAAETISVSVNRLLMLFAGSSNVVQTTTGV